MLKKHKNILFAKLEQEGFNLNDFEFIPSPPRVDILQVKDTGLYFRFTQQEENYEKFKYAYTNFAPTPQVATTQATYYFQQVMDAVSSWLKNEVFQYIAERQGDDYFENFKKRQSEFNFENINFDSKIFFSLDESKEIITRLEYLNSFLIDSFSKNEEQTLIITNSIKYLSESLSNQNKFNWKSIFISTIIGIITNLSVDSTKGQEIWNVIIDIFKKIPIVGN